MGFFSERKKEKNRRGQLGPSFSPRTFDGEPPPSLLRRPPRPPPSPSPSSGYAMDSAAPNPGAAAAAAAGNGVQASGAGGERPEDASKQNLAQVTSSIQKTLGLLHQLNLTVSSFNSASQLPLLQRL